MAQIQTAAMTPAELAQAAACFCYDERTANAVLIYLLKTVAGVDQTPAELASNAKCFCYADRNVQTAVITYLLTQIANA